MNTKIFARLETDIRQLTLGEQVQLMEWLAQTIRKRTIQQGIQDELVTMAADPDIQREIRLIEAEFAETEADGLIDE